MSDTAIKDAEKQIYLTIVKEGEVWKVYGQLETERMGDLMDMMMILMTNAVRLGLQVTDTSRSLKPMEKAMVAQLKDIIKGEAREVREERKHGKPAQSSDQEDA